MGLNREQGIAVETIDRNLAVMAGAGTGKTKVLTERYLEILDRGHLEQGKEIESIVAITFTKKATQEMIHRIREGIRKNFPKEAKWRRYYRDMEKSNISTIDSFCAKILRENPVEAGIDPLFEILEDKKAQKMLKDSIKYVLEKGIREDDQIYETIKKFGKINSGELIGDFYSLYEKIRTVGFSFSEVEKMTLKYLDSLADKKVDLAYIREGFLYLMDRLPKNTKIYKLRNEPIWTNFEKGQYGEGELFGIISYLYENMGKSSKEAEKMESLKNALKGFLLASEYGNVDSYKVILKLLIEIDSQYEKEKEAIRSLDYGDLEIKLLKLLDNESIRDSCQSRFKYIMIDEFQDTNELQRKIFYRLASQKESLDRSNLFVVGDPNQSIYGFRGADLDVFYSVVSDIKKSTGEDAISIKTNYRTVNTVLDFINNIFASLMGEGYGSLDSYKNSNKQIDIEILENEELEVAQGINASSYHRYYEADLIAKRIKQLVLSNSYKYGDFALLFRASTRTHIYEKALIRYGIPFYNLGGKGFFQQQEILDLINALKAISNPFDTIASIGFLRSPMIGLSDSLIYWILRFRKTIVLDSMKGIVENKSLEDEEIHNLQDAIDMIQGLRDFKNCHGLLETVNEIISKSYYAESLLLRQGGRQALANLNKFREMVDKYEKDNIGSVEDLIDLFEELKAGDESQARLESEEADVVKILTIHKSKGLQFPVVIIPEMASSKKTSYSNILFSKDRGIGIQLNSGREIYNDIKNQLSSKEEEELKRILYVAMTRAEEMLILGFQGRNSGFKKMIKNLINPLQYRLISEIQIEAEGPAPMTLIKEAYSSKKGPVEVDLPLLYEIPEYRRKSIESFSVSQYLAFTECNRKFYLDYYHRIASLDIEIDEVSRTRGLGALDRGNIVHKFSEHYKSGIDVEMLLGDICKSFGIQYTKDIYNELKIYIDNYIRQYRDDFEAVYIEKPFYLQLNNSYVKGFIDRINIKDGKAEILDYKTNRLVDKKALVDKYTPQLQLYAYVTREIMNIELERARIVFLENGDYADIPIGDEDLNKNLERIGKFIDFVSNNREIESYGKSSECSQYCSHRGFCQLDKKEL